jgi:hypothetical protein
MQVISKWETADNATEYLNRYKSSGAVLNKFYIYYYYLLQLGFHPVAVVLD